MALERIRKNDTVVVIAGRERGKSGKVLRVLHERGRVVVEHVNMIKRHLKARGVQSPGGIVEREAAIHVSNVQPVCPKCQKAARISTRRTAGEAVRVCRRCGQQLENP
jgi:large subunit ribosomal protein L24